MKEGAFTFNPEEWVADDSKSSKSSSVNGKEIPKSNSPLQKKGVVVDYNGMVNEEISKDASTKKYFCYLFHTACEEKAYAPDVLIWETCIGRVSVLLKIETKLRAYFEEGCKARRCLGLSSFGGSIG